MDNAVVVARCNNGDKPAFCDAIMGGLDGNPLDVRGARVEEPSHVLPESPRARFCGRVVGAVGYS